MSLIDRILKSEVRNGKVSYTLDLTWPLVALSLLLALLKLSLFEGMSWWAVTAPIWVIPALIISLFAGILTIIALVTVGYWLSGNKPPFKWTRKKR